MHIIVQQKPIQHCSYLIKNKLKVQKIKYKTKKFNNFYSELEVQK